jgi:hypothetical protein
MRSLLLILLPCCRQGKLAAEMQGLGLPVMVDWGTNVKVSMTSCLVLTAGQVVLQHPRHDN